MDASLWPWIIALIVAGASAYFCYRTAERKGRSGLAFGLLGFFVPLIGIIVILVLPAAERPSA